MNAIKAKRTEKGLTLQKLADLSGVSTYSISRWEKGRSTPSLLCLIQVARALGCPLSDLDEGIRARKGKPMKRTVTALELAEIYGVSRNTILLWISQGLLKATMEDHCYYITKKDIADFESCKI